MSLTRFRCIFANSQMSKQHLLFLLYVHSVCGVYNTYIRIQYTALSISNFIFVVVDEYYVWILFHSSFVAICLFCRSRLSDSFVSFTVSFLIIFSLIRKCNFYVSIYVPPPCTVYSVCVSSPTIIKSQAYSEVNAGHHVVCSSSN